MTTTAQLAETFCNLLKEALSPEQFAECVARNDKSEEPCPTHDFLDANEIMLAAMDKHGLPFDPESEATTNTINDAWALARLYDYSVSAEKIEAEQRDRTERAMIAVYDQLLELHELEGIDAMEHLAGDLTPQARADLSLFVQLWERLSQANRI